MYNIYIYIYTHTHACTYTQISRKKKFLKLYVKETNAITINNIKRKRVKELWASKTYRKLPSTVKNKKFI